MLFKVSVVLVLMALSAPSQVRAADPYTIFVRTQCNGDSVGERIGYKVREGIRKSTSMTTVESISDSIVQMSIVCIDPDPDQAGSVSRYSYAITTTNTDGHYDFLITHGVGSCGTRRVDECSEGLVADIDSAISDALRRIKDGTFKYKPKK